MVLALYGDEWHPWCNQQMGLPMYRVWTLNAHSPGERLGGEVMQIHARRATNHMDNRCIRFGPTLILPLKGEEIFLKRFFGSFDLCSGNFTAHKVYILRMHRLAL